MARAGHGSPAFDPSARPSRASFDQEGCRGHAVDARRIRRLAQAPHELAQFFMSGSGAPTYAIKSVISDIRMCVFKRVPLPRMVTCRLVR